MCTVGIRRPQKSKKNIFVVKQMAHKKNLEMPRFTKGCSYKHLGLFGQK